MTERDKPRQGAPQTGQAPADKTASGPGLLYPPTDGAHAAALAASSSAFARGDFRQARRLARQVLAEEPLAEERSFAQEILRRISWDPVALAVGLGSMLILVLTLILTL